MCQQRIKKEMRKIEMIFIMAATMVEGIVVEDVVETSIEIEIDNAKEIMADEAIEVGTTEIAIDKETEIQIAQMEDGPSIRREVYIRQDSKMNHVRRPLTWLQHLGTMMTNQLHRRNHHGISQRRRETVNDLSGQCAAAPAVFIK